MPKSENRDNPFRKLKNSAILGYSASQVHFKSIITLGRKYGLYFIPSIVLLLSGIASYIDRTLLPSMISVSICSLGVLAVVLTYKFLTVYMIAKDVMSKVDAHVVFQSRNQAAVPTQILDLLDDEDVDPSGQGYH